MSLTRVSFSMITGAPANVKDFGAVGDGVTDDSAAIQAALDSGRPVYFDSSSYCASELTVSTIGQQIIGNSTRLLYNGTATHLMRVTANKVSISGFSYIGSSNPAAPRTVDPTRGLIFIDSGITGFSFCDNADCGYIKNNVPNDCYFIYSKGNGVQDVVISRNKFTEIACDNDGVIGNFCGAVFFELDSSVATRGHGLQIFDNAFQAIYGIPTGGTLRSDANGVRVFCNTATLDTPAIADTTRIEVTNNTFVDIQQVAVKLSGCNNTVVSNNIILSGDVDRYPAVTNTSGGLGEKGSRGGIELRGGNAVVSGNLLEDLGSTNISMNGALGKSMKFSSAVTGNRVSIWSGAPAGRTGITVRQENCVVSGNIVNSTVSTHFGFSVRADNPYFSATEITEVYLSGNQANGCGVLLIDAEQCVVSDQKIIGSVFEIRRIARCKLDGFEIRATGVPFVGTTGAGNECFDNEITNMSLDITLPDAFTGSVFGFSLLNLQRTTVGYLRMKLTSATGIVDATCRPFDVSTENNLIGAVHIIWSGAGANLADFLARIFASNNHIDTIVFEVENTGSNSSAKSLAVNAGTDEVSLGLVVSKTAVGNITNNGVGTKFGGVISTATIVDAGSGTHTIGYQI